MTREQALREIALFREIVNSGMVGTPEQWKRCDELMKKFDITLEEIAGR